MEGTSVPSPWPLRDPASVPRVRLPRPGRRQYPALGFRGLWGRLCLKFGQYTPPRPGFGRRGAVTAAALVLVVPALMFSAPAAALAALADCPAHGGSYLAATARGHGHCAQPCAPRMAQPSSN